MGSASVSSEPWSLTILRAQSILSLRPEKAWRPIVTVDVGPHQQHELVLGCDGQNPNLKSAFLLRDADERTTASLQIWHRSQSKKKGKKRNLVAQAPLPLGEMLRKHGSDAKIEVRLTSASRTPVQRVRGQRCGASIVIRLRAPGSAESSTSSTLMEDDHYLSEAGFSDMPHTDASRPMSSAVSECDPIELPSPIPEETTLRRRKRKTRVKGYKLFSDEDSPLESEDDGFSSDAGLSPAQSVWICDEEIDEEDNSASECGSASIMTPLPVRSSGPLSWITASIIPMYSDQASILSNGSSRSRVETWVDVFSPYEELRRAEETSEEAEMEKVLERLKTEWYCVGASLVALAGLDAAVFGFSKDSIFTIDEFAQNAVACSSIASGLGLLSVSWFLTIYSGADVRKFQRLSLDVYQTYFFFCLSCRLPTLCMSVSALALAAFLLRVAWRTWRTAVLVMCFGAGILVTLQYLVYGVHCVIKGMMRVGRAVRRGLRTLMGRARGSRGMSGSVEEGAPDAGAAPVEDAVVVLTPASPQSVSGAPSGDVTTEEQDVTGS